MTITQTTTTKPNHYYFRVLVALAALALVASLLVLTSAKPAHASKNFFVTSTGDEADFDLTDGRCDVESPTSPLTRCTLRAAIQEANTQPDADAIFFNIPGTGVRTIRPSSPLPAITDPVTIDGYTQGAFTSDPADDAKPNTLTKGTNAVLKIELDGSNAGPAFGLSIETSDSVVKGLVVNRFNSTGIEVAGSRNKIEGNFIGTDPSGTTAQGNHFAGVDVEGFLGDAASGNVIGGFSPDQHNLISGNEGPGVSLLGKLAVSNQVLGNLIGTQKDGKSPLGNSRGGVGIFGAQRSLVGTINSGTVNTIAFNGLGGIVVGNGSDSSTASNEIVRNSIFSNAGLGIDLGNDGATANDPDDPNTSQVDPDSDTGPNALLNKPVLTSAKTVSGKTTVKGRLNSQPNENFLVLFFSNPSGNEGKRFIGEKLVSTDGSGKGSFIFTPKKSVAVGKTITAITIDTKVNTSEFSAPKKVVAS